MESKLDGQRDFITRFNRMDNNKDKFPDLNLEDKVPVKVEGIDRPQRSQRVSRPNQKYLDRVLSCNAWRRNLFV